ncbi:MAG: hypothetical protein Kow0099_15840 [Candidatus Abyssubacteria bacterium]
MKRISLILKIIISVALLFILFRNANLSKAAQYAGSLRYTYILASIVLIVLGQIVRSHRLAVLVFGDLSARRMWQVLRIQMVSFLPGVISPAKIGEITKVYMLNREAEVPVLRGLICFVAERVLDLLLLGPLAAVGLFALLRSGLHIYVKPGWVHMAVVAWLSVFAALAVGLMWTRRRGITATAVWETVSPRSLCVAAVMTVLYWGIVFVEVWCFCEASLFDTAVWHMAIVVPPALLSSMIPISFSGFGLREAAMVILLQRPPLGAPYERALLISLLYDIVGLGIPAGMGVIFWMTKKTDAAPHA